MIALATNPHAPVLLVLYAVDDAANALRQRIIEYWQTRTVGVDLLGALRAKDRLRKLGRQAQAEPHEHVNTVFCKKVESD